MQRTLGDMQTTARSAANVRWWTQQYPWYAVGAAALLGFFAVRKLQAPVPPAPPTGRPAAPSSSWLTPLFEMLRTTLMSAIIGAVHTSGEKTGVQQVHEEQPWQRTGHDA